MVYWSRVIEYEMLLIKNREQPGDDRILQKKNYLITKEDNNGWDNSLNILFWAMWPKRYFLMLSKYLWNENKDCAMDSGTLDH